MKFAWSHTTIYLDRATIADNRVVLQTLGRSVKPVIELYQLPGSCNMQLGKDTLQRCMTHRQDSLHLVCMLPPRTVFHMCDATRIV